MRKILIILTSMVVLGCTTETKLAKDDKNIIATCTDTRDGEVFKFNSNTIHNAMWGIGSPSSFDLITLDGKKMTLTSDMEAWIKCEHKKAEK